MEWKIVTKSGENWRSSCKVTVWASSFCSNQQL